MMMTMEGHTSAGAKPKIWLMYISDISEVSPVNMVLSSSISHRTPLITSWLKIGFFGQRRGSFATAISPVEPSAASTRSKSS